MVALFTVLELFTNLVLETVLYAGAAGVSQVALLISVAFWTWLWGPLGLLMATPLTVCLVVLGKHVPGLGLFCTLMADTPALAPEYAYYQRLLARDQSEAADLIERHIKTESPGHGVRRAHPSGAELRRARSHRAAAVAGGGSRRLSTRRGSSSSTPRQRCAGSRLRCRRDAARRSPRLQSRPPSCGPVGVLAYAANGVGRRDCPRHAGAALADLPIALEISQTRMLAAGCHGSHRGEEVLDRVHRGSCRRAPRRRRDIWSRGCARHFPDLRIVVGRWAPPALADENTQVLRDAGATHVASTLIETRDYLATLVDVAPARDIDAA